MFAGEQCELGIEADVLHSFVTEFNTMLTEKVDESQFNLELTNL